MGITIGQQLGSYEITALLGKGGMGEVYRARDARLKRDVAIKILPDEFSFDAERVSRFQREAEVLASLNHPNIAGIHDLQEANDTRFLILELVEGETLADRIVGETALPVEEALNIAIQICDALEAAHEKGIIHRDLKPANVKISPDGKAKVLDCGCRQIENLRCMATVPTSSVLKRYTSQ
jgi:serine/threonine protein kinase